jgi:hypothetical protein
VPPLTVVQTGFGRVDFQIVVSVPLSGGFGPPQGQHRLRPQQAEMVKGYVGKFAEVTEKAKSKSGTMNLQSVKPDPSGSILQGDPGRRLLDVRMFKTQGSAKTFEKVRHEFYLPRAVSRLKNYFFGET